MISKKNIFICPECGSEIIKEKFYYKKKSDNNLYSSVLYEIQCGSCFIDIPGHIGERHQNISIEQAQQEWKNIYKPEHLKDAVKCSVCNLYYYEIEKKLNLAFDENINIFMQKFTKFGKPDLICRLCEPDNFK